MSRQEDDEAFVNEFTTLTDFDWATLAADELNQKNAGSGRAPLRPEDAVVVHTDHGTVRCTWRLGRDQ